MNLLNKLNIVVLLGLLAAGSAFGQSAIRKNCPLARQMPQALAAGKISAENVNKLWIGYDFDTAAAYMKDEKQLRESITQLTFLWDELYLQPEAADIEALMRMMVRGEGDLDFRLARLAKAKASVEKRLTGEARWYYSVGLAYSEMTTAYNEENIQAFKAKLTELGRLSKVAPAGAPVELTSALSKFGSLSTRPQFGDDEFAFWQLQCEVVDHMIAA